MLTAEGAGVPPCLPPHTPFLFTLPPSHSHSATCPQEMTPPCYPYFWNQSVALKSREFLTLCICVQACVRSLFPHRRGPVVCFRCKQPGHVKSVCPMPSSKRKGKSATSTQSVDASAAPIEPVVSSSDPVVTVEPSVSPLAAAVVSADPLVAVEPAAIPPQSGVVASDPVDTASVILSTTDTVSAPAPVVVGIDAAVVESSTPTPATALRVPAQHPAEGGGCCCIS